MKRLIKHHLPAFIVVATFTWGCGTIADPNHDNAGPEFARAAADPTVTATQPSYAHQGDAGITVRVLGSGFDQGSIATWQRGGVADPKVTVQSTSFVSTTELSARISVASDATIALYDVAVTASTGKKGIGTEMFTVTAAQSIGTLGGNTLARAVNDAGATVGYSMLGTSQHAFLSPSAGATLVDLGTGQAYDIDAAGGTIAGIVAGAAVVWRGSGTAWAPSGLPDIGAGSRAITLTTTTSGLLVGGSVTAKLSGNKTQERPALWQASGSGWTLQTYPVPGGFSNGWIEDVNSSGQAVGVGRDPYSQAYFWDANGAATALPSVSGDRTAFANGIDPTGTIIVGQSGSRAVYWKKNAAGQWAVSVLESCGRATDVNGKGMIVGQGCSNATLWLLNADGTVTRKPLPGLGGSSDAPAVEAINDADFPVAAGKAKQQGSSVDQGVIWNLSVVLGQ